MRRRFIVSDSETLAKAAEDAKLTSLGGAAINLLRTRLQASGSPGHPQQYTGFVDVARQTLAREGWPGLYKGLVPNLAKVVPAVSISYVVSLCRGCLLDFSSVVSADGRTWRGFVSRDKEERCTWDG